MARRQAERRPTGKKGGAQIVTGGDSHQDTAAAGALSHPDIAMLPDDMRDWALADERLAAVIARMLRRPGVLDHIAKGTGTLVMATVPLTGAGRADYECDRCSRYCPSHLTPMAVMLGRREGEPLVLLSLGLCRACTGDLYAVHTAPTDNGSAVRRVRDLIAGGAR